VYEPLFEPQAPVAGTDETLYGPFRDLLREINDPDDTDWLERVDARLDLPALLGHVAAEAFMAENDGFLGYAGINNFYVYRYAGTSRHRVLSWDRDFAFTFLVKSIFDRVDENVLLRRALAMPAIRSQYLDAVDAASAAATADGWLANEVERLASLIMPSAIKDRRKPFTNQTFLEAVDFLRLFAAERAALVADEVAAARAELAEQEPSPPEATPAASLKRRAAAAGGGRRP
jgi:hypothetical protein